MPGAEITLTSKEPSPPEADFAFYIDFVRGHGSPTRIFVAAQEFILACESLDRTLAGVIDSHIEPIMVLEEVETGSLKIWLRNILRSADDDGLKALDWKPLVGKYLVRAKYIVLRWLDEDGDAPKSLPALTRELQQLAAETDVRHMPDYARPKPQDLIESLATFQKAKDALMPGDRAKFVSYEGDVDFNLAVRWGPEELADLAVGQTIQMPPAPMILAVKKPDYLGESQWEFRHGKSPIKAKIEDAKWLAEFQNREHDVRPGDALKCVVVIENAYGFDNELISQKYVITKVEEVLADRYRQARLFTDDDASE